MADLRQVEIILKSETTSTTQKPSEKIKTGTKNQVQKQNTDYVGAVVANQTWGNIKSGITKIATYEINKTNSLRDDYVTQQTISHATTLISTIKNIAVAGYAGYQIGGPWGAAIFAVGQTALSVIDMAQNVNKQYVQLQQMDAQLQYQRQRAGYSLTSGRVGENR